MIRGEDYDEEQDKVLGDLDSPGIDIRKVATGKFWKNGKAPIIDFEELSDAQRKRLRFNKLSTKE